MKHQKINKIGEVLKRQGRTQVWMGAQLGMSQPAINALCRNRTQPSLKKLRLIASKIGVQPGDLIEPVPAGTTEIPPQLPNMDT